MKKTKLFVLSTLMLGLTLTACGGKKEDSSSSILSENPSTSSLPDSSSVSSSETSSSGGQTQEEMPVYAKSIDKDARTRAYKEEFDRMIDDFSSSTLQGTLSGDAYAVGSSYLQVSINSQSAETYPSNDDRSIYKQASGDYSIHSFDAVKFRMRVTKGELKKEDLVLGLRGDDAFNLYELSLADALDNDSEEIPELTGEWQDIIVSPMNSIEDSDTVYTSKSSGEPTTVKVLEQIIGFHLYAREGVNAVVEIESVTGIAGKKETVLDDFERREVNGSTGHTWWNDSTGHIITRSAILDNGGSYTTLASEGLDDYENVVLSLKSESSAITLTPILTGGVEGTSKSWVDLKDDQNISVKNPVNGAYGSYVVSLANSGITDTGIVGFKITAADWTSVDTIFMTNMSEKTAATEFPKLDTENAVVFDDFNRTQNSIDTSYDSAVLNPIVTGAGLNYAISYHNEDKIKIADGAVTFDATSLAENDYIQFVEGSKSSRGDHRYMVISTKLEDGATLDGFRIEAGGKTIWYNDLYAAQGLKTSSDVNPYVKDGFTWQVIDLELSDLDAIDGEVVMYYSGTGKLSIDTIFFVSEPGLSAKAFAETAKVLDATDMAQQSLVAGVNEGAKLIRLTYRGDGTHDLSSFRIEGAGDNPAIFANSGGLKMSVGGEAVDSTFVAPADTDTIMLIDLEASGWTDFTTEVKLMLGDWAEGYMDIQNVEMLVEKDFIEWRDFEIAEEVSLTPTDGDMHKFFYVGWSEGAETITLTLKGDGTADLESFRFELTDAENQMVAYYANATLAMSVNGEAIDSTYVIPEEGVTIVFDLKASGGVSLDGVNITLVYGDWANADQTLTIVSGTKGVNTLTVDKIMSSVPEMTIPGEITE